MLDVSAAFATTTGQLDIFLTNTADTANVSVSNGEIIISDRQNQAVAIQVDGGEPGTVNASNVGRLEVRGDAASDQTVVLHSPLALPKGLAIDAAMERAEIVASISRVSAGDIRSNAIRTQLGADLEAASNDIFFGGDVQLTNDIQLIAVDVTFGGNVDDDGNASSTSRLFVSSSGVTRFSSDVGARSPITQIETDPVGTTELNGNIATLAGTVIFADPVTLTSNVSISDTGPTGIIFGNTVDSAADAHFGLSLSAINGRVEFNGNLGAGAAIDTRIGSLVVEQAANGVLFRNAGTVTTVNVLGEVNIGRNATPIGGSGIVLNAGTSLFQLNTFGGSLRFHGAVHLKTDASFDTANGNITFTSATPIDSDLDRTQSLTIDAGAGAVYFNEDIGANVALRGLVITRAASVTFGGSDTEVAGRGPVERVQSVDAIQIGSAANAIAGGIVFNAGNQTLQVTTTEDNVTVHGPITLASALNIDTGTGPGNIVFGSGRIDSQTGETNDLVLRAGTGSVAFNGNIGAAAALGSLTITQADAGVSFGTADNFLLAAGQGPVTFVQATRGIDIGSGANEIQGSGIVLNGGVGGRIQLSSASGDIRLNGSIRLDTDVEINSGLTSGDIIFTNDAPIDSQLGETNALTLDAGDGSVLFNANIGEKQRLDQLRILRAAQNVVFGGADQRELAGSGPVTFIGTTSGINIGAGTSVDNIVGQVVLNGGSSTIGLSTLGTDIRINGKTTLQSRVLFDTGTRDATRSGSGDLIFTTAATIDSQAGEENALDVDLDVGDAFFQASLGATSRLGNITLVHLANAAFEAPITAGRLWQLQGTGKTTFQGNIDTNHPEEAGLLLVGREFDFHSPVLATGFGSVVIIHRGLLDLNPAADMQLDGGFSETGGGRVELAASIATSRDPIFFNGPVTLTDGAAGDILLSTVAAGVPTPGGHEIFFGRSVNGQTAEAENLLLNTGTTGSVVFEENVGDVTRLGTITVVEANDVTFHQGLSATRVVQLSGQGDTEFLGPVSLNHSSLSALAVNTVNVRIQNQFNTTGAGSILANVSGLFELANQASLQLSGSFQQLGSGAVRTGADMITSGSNILFNGAVTLTDDVFLRIGQLSGRLVFAQTLDGLTPFTESLRIFALTGDIEFSGVVGGTVPLDLIIIEQNDDLFIRREIVTGSFIQSLGSGITRIEEEMQVRTPGQPLSLRSRFIDLQANLTALNSPVVLKADQDLVISANIATDTTDITLTADQDVIIGAATNITTQFGNIAVTADGNISGGGEVRMSDGAVLRSLRSSIAISATDDITLARLISPLPIWLTSTSGGIIDSGDTGGVNVEAPSLATRTMAGVGSSNMIETRISALAALNTGAGGIRITNNGGGLLTIGDVAGLSGLIDGGSGQVEIINLGAMNVDRPIRNGGGGDTILRAEFPGGNVTVNQPIQNTGGDGFILMFAGGDLAIHDSLPEPRDAQGTQIEYPANPEQFFEIYAVGDGGVRGEAVGSVRIDKGDQNFVIVHTDTGQITNVRPILSIETLDQGGSDIDELGRAFVRVTLGDEVHLETNYQITIDWGDGEIEHFPIPGTIDPLRLQFKGNTEPRFISGAEGEEGVYTFLHRYFANPNPDPSAPIQIRVEARHDPRSSGNTAIDANRPSTASGVFNGIRFFENAAEEIFTSRTDFFTLPGLGGIGFVKVVEGVIVPVEARAPAVEPPIRTAPAFTGSFGTTHELATASFEIGAQEEYRVFMRVVDDVLGTESEDIPLELSVLDDPVAIFRQTRFPNGHYRIYLEEIKTRRIRVILDVYIYNGRVVPPDFRTNAAEKPAGADEQPVAQPQPNQNGSTEMSDGSDPLETERTSATHSQLTERYIKEDATPEVAASRGTSQTAMPRRIAR